MQDSSYTVPVPEGKFSQEARERLGDSIYLLGYLIHRANWEKGRLRTNCARISQDTGFPRATIRKWIDALRRAGEISTRRIPDGLIIIVSDYAPIARTRKVAYIGDGPRVVDPPKSDSPAVDAPPPASGQPDSPLVDAGSPADGQSNIKQIPSQIPVQNELQNLISSLLDAEEGTPFGRGAGREGIFDYTTDRERRIRRSKELVRQMNQARRVSVFTEAMEEMQRDPRPFVRHFVHRDHLGDLAPRGKDGPWMVLERVGEIAERVGRREDGGAGPGRRPGELGSGVRDPEPSIS